MSSEVRASAYDIEFENLQQAHDLQRCQCMRRPRAPNRRAGRRCRTAKSFDTFTPMGPALATLDEVTDPDDLHLRTWVDGELRQDARTSQLIHPVAELVSYLSRQTKLEPGDVISTGTPSGVGHPQGRYLRSGNRSRSRSRTSVYSSTPAPDPRRSGGNMPRLGGTAVVRIRNTRRCPGAYTLFLADEDSVYTSRGAGQVTSRHSSRHTRSWIRGKAMFCCVLLCGLVLLGPRGVRFWRLIRGAEPERSTARPPDEVASSSHLVLSPAKAEGWS